jgi:hypothetical protein
MCDSSPSISIPNPNFSKCRAGDGSAVQTESQQAWRATCRVAHARYMNKRQDKHDEGWSMAKALVSSSVFTNFINLTIALNIGEI